MDKHNHNHTEDEWYHKERLMFVFLRVLVSLVLLIGGIIMLALRIPGWGIIFGLPMIVFGSVFIIYTYDEVLSKRIETHAPEERKGSTGEDE